MPDSLQEESKNQDLEENVASGECKTLQISKPSGFNETVDFYKSTYTRIN
jgi:hypothetical protein